MEPASEIFQFICHVLLCLAKRAALNPQSTPSILESRGKLRMYTCSYLARVPSHLEARKEYLWGSVGHPTYTLMIRRNRDVCLRPLSA